MRWTSALLIVLIATGCEKLDLRRSGKETGPEATPPAGQTQPDGNVLETEAQPDDQARGRVMAYVNDSPVYMADLHDLLVLANGRKAAQNLVAWKLVDQEADKRGAAVTEDDIDAEHEATLARMFPGIDDQADRAVLLKQLMTREAIPDKQWRMSMRMQAQLTKMLLPELQVSPEERQQVFADKYGRQIVIRHIQSATLAEAEEALRQLRDGADFAQLAQQVSKNASRSDGGLLPPISANPKILPAALHKEAWSMTRKGQISDPVQAGTSYHILYVEKIVEPQDVALEDVTEELEAAAKRGKMRTAKERFLQQIIGDADIKWMDPILQQQTARAGQTRMVQP